jgi:hypothetical protein
MARSRNIKPGFFLNDKLAEIEPLGREKTAMGKDHQEKEMS